MAAPKKPTNSRSVAAANVKRTADAKTAGSQRAGMASTRNKAQVKREVGKQMAGKSKPKVAESGMGLYAAAKVVGAVAKRFTSKSQTRTPVVRFIDPKTKAKPPAAAKPSDKKATKAAKEQSSAAKSYTTKDPSRVSAAQKGAETRRRNAEAAMRAERRKGRRQGAIAVGATGTAALGVSAASGATKSKKK